MSLRAGLTSSPQRIKTAAHALEADPQQPDPRSPPGGVAAAYRPSSSTAQVRTRTLGRV